MKRIIALLCVLVFTAGCENDCEDLACFTSPPGFNFELVDSETGENLFTSGSLDPSEINVSSANGEPVEFRFISEDEINIIGIGLGWDTENSEYELTVGEELVIDLVVDSEKKSEDCCTFYEVLEFDIPGYEYEQSNTTGFIRIFVPGVAEGSGSPNSLTE